MEKLVFVVVDVAVVVVAAAVVLADFAVKTLHYLNCHSGLVSSFLVFQTSIETNLWSKRNLRLFKVCDNYVLSV